MSLSQPTISAIVSALLHERENLKADLAFWSLRASRVGKTHCQQINQSLQDNATALTELANGMAPWLKQHPQYGFITKSKTALSPNRKTPHELAHSISARSPDSPRRGLRQHH